MNNLQAAQLFYLALELQQMHALAESEALYREALTLAPDRPSILANLAAVLAAQQRYEEAETLCLRLIELDDTDDEALTTLGICLSNSGRKEEALQVFGRASQINPQNVEALGGYGNVQLDLGHAEEALDSYDRALQINAQHADTLNNRGSALLTLRRLSEALHCFERALEIRPAYPEALNNLGNTLRAANRIPAALASYDEACRIRPDYVRAKWNAGLCRLALGDFAVGWEHYEWGWREGQRGERLDPGKPWWNGQPLQGTLLVWSEQGIGDQILFSSMLPTLVNQVARIVVAVDPRLVQLMQRSFSGITIVPRDKDIAKIQFDAHIAMGSLGQYLRQQWSDFMPANSYIRADPLRTAKLRQRLGDIKQHCGISWASSNNAYAKGKSIALDYLRPLLELENINAVNLQYGDTAKERHRFETATLVRITHFDDIDNYNDIDGLAALIDACDVVVTISNTTAHIAGAMGKSTFLLLPYGDSCHWYWHEGQLPNPWYANIKVFRQSPNMGWDDAISNIKKNLENFSGK